ncbi:MAG: carboxypeptidase-like regulatory domain-containing protein [Bacteroidales bacterium]|nr:carboxypeptidase-like regulatory domain-containing protein [Bacteroidales bacterium]
MTTNQKIRLRMYLGTRNFVSQNEATANRIPKFATAYAILLNTTDEIQLIGEMQGINKTGLAMDKNKLKMTLIALAVKYSNKVAILAKLTNNDTLLKEVRFNESDLVRLSEVTLKERVQIIYDKAEANIVNLAEQGITPDTQKVFLETITAFNKALETSRTGIAEKRKATQKLPVLFDKADSEIEIMDLAAGSSKDEFPDFFNGYKTSRKLIDSNSGTLALIASARELINGEPLSGAIFIFTHEASIATGSNGNGEIVKKTSKKGNFHVKNMEPGTYKVVVSKQGFKKKEVTVSIADGERSELNVEMEKA